MSNGRIVIENGNDFKEKVQKTTQQKGYKSCKDYIVDLVERDISNPSPQSSHTQKQINSLYASVLSLANNPQITTLNNPYINADLLRMEETLCQMM